VTNRRVEEHPDSPNAYFGRHQAWERLGWLDLALADLEKSLALEDHFVTQRAKGGVLHAMGGYQEAIACLDRCERTEPENWTEALGPLIRADCHARAGASSRNATRFKAPSGSPAASARAAAVISESTGIPPHLSLSPVETRRQSSAPPPRE
jgi:tetratricopeptide (TPR) repeat protein